MAEEKISMPMTSAGILSVGSDIKISGIEMEPRAVIVGTVIFVVLVKLAIVFIK